MKNFIRYLVFLSGTGMDFTMLGVGGFTAPLSSKVTYNYNDGGAMVDLPSISRYNRRDDELPSSLLVLYANSNDKKRGVYSRPSAAIERGSGFFIPGLEGGRVRIAASILLGVANQFGNFDSTSPTDYWITNIFCSILFLQAAILENFSFPNNSNGDNDNYNTTGESDTPKSSSSTKKQVQQYSSFPKNDEKLLEPSSWVASTLMALTPATTVSILSNTNGLLYQQFSTLTKSTETIRIDASTQERYFDILSKSQTGRVSVPPNDNDTNDNKTIILQRISNDQCLVITSNQLLVAFTKNDLKWIRSLANYLQQQQLQQK